MSFPFSAIVENLITSPIALAITLLILIIIVLFIHSYVTSPSGAEAKGAKGSTMIRAGGKITNSIIKGNRADGVDSLVDVAGDIERTEVEDNLLNKSPPNSPIEFEGFETITDVHDVSRAFLKIKNQDPNNSVEGVKILMVPKTELGVLLSPKTFVLLCEDPIEGRTMGKQDFDPSEEKKFILCEVKRTTKFPQIQLFLAPRTSFSTKNDEVYFDVQCTGRNIPRKTWNFKSWIEGKPNNSIILKSERLDV